MGGGRWTARRSVNQTNLSVLNQTITNWPPGAALWLVWQMTDASGKPRAWALTTWLLGERLAATDEHPGFRDKRFVKLADHHGRKLSTRIQ